MPLAPTGARRRHQRASGLVRCAGHKALVLHYYCCSNLPLLSFTSRIFIPGLWRAHVRRFSSTCICPPAGDHEVCVCVWGGTAYEYSGTKESWVPRVAACSCTAGAAACTHQRRRAFRVIEVRPDSVPVPVDLRGATVRRHQAQPHDCGREGRNRRSWGTHGYNRSSLTFQGLMTLANYMASKLADGFGSGSN